MFEHGGYKLNMVVMFKPIGSLNYREGGYKYRRFIEFGAFWATIWRFVIFVG